MHVTFSNIFIYNNKLCYLRKYVIRATKKKKKKKEKETYLNHFSSDSETLSSLQQKVKYILHLSLIGFD